MLIRPKTCRTCKSSEPGASADMLTCHLNPPSFGPVVVPVGPGKMMVQMHGGFAPVKEGDWCEQHRPRLAIVANEAKAA